MGYITNLDTGQTVYLENQGILTLVTVMMTSTGQQQQSSNTIETGKWTSPPEIFRHTSGIMIKIQGEKGQSYLTIQGNSMNIVNQFQGIDNLQQLSFRQVDQSPVKPLEPMKPLPPMKMGNMEMKMSPMEMKMGDMKMGFNTPSGPNFCSQCGQPVQPNDKFCSNCGHKLLNN